MRPLRPALAALCASGLAAACGTASAPNPYYDASRPHHRPGGFQNNYLEFKPQAFVSDVLIGWKLPALFKGLPLPPTAAPPTATPALDFLHANAGAAMRPSATFIGHATVLLQVPAPGGGLNVLTDPVFGARASPLSFAGPKRFQPPGAMPAELPRIDIVLVSHNHYDHLDEGSVKTLAAQAGGSPLFVVPLGLAPWLAERGIGNLIELDWWDSVALPPGPRDHPPQAGEAQVQVQRNGAGLAAAPADSVQVFLTPSQHWSGRGLNDRLQTLWGGFAVLSPNWHAFFAGDTAYSQDFADIQARFAPRQSEAQGGGFDIALLPVGAYEPRWFMRSQHVNPEESVRIHRDLQAKRSLGVHWGTFALTDEALDQPPHDLATARQAQGVADEDFFTLAIGETRQLPERPAAP